MALFSVKNVSLRGIAAAVPKQSESNHDYDWITEKERSLLIKTTGVENRRKAPPGFCTSDYCFEAATKLLRDLKWNSADIGLVVFVSQSPDYFLPATSIILQNRLGLPQTSLAFDILLGCSGFVYGLSVVSNMMSNTGIKKALLLTGDVSTISVSYQDKSTYPLFGDGGTATALEWNENASPVYFNLQSDGSGYEAITIKDGACRNPMSKASEEMEEVEKGVIRRRRDLSIKGMDVFNFSVTKVPPNVKETLAYAGWSKTDPDFFVMHQANLLLNETVRKVLGIEAARVPYSLKDFGNTSSASIPLTMVTQIADKLRNAKCKLMFSGFGVGLSWGTVLLETDNLVVSELIEI